MEAPESTSRSLAEINQKITSMSRSLQTMENVVKGLVDHIMQQGGVKGGADIAVVLKEELHTLKNKMEDMDVRFMTKVPSFLYMRSLSVAAGIDLFILFSFFVVVPSIVPAPLDADATEQIALVDVLWCGSPDHPPVCGHGSLPLVQEAPEEAREEVYLNNQRSRGWANLRELEPGYQSAAEGHHRCEKAFESSSSRHVRFNFCGVFAQ